MKHVLGLTEKTGDRLAREYLTELIEQMKQWNMSKIDKEWAIDYIEDYMNYVISYHYISVNFIREMKHLFDFILRDDEHGDKKWLCLIYYCSSTGKRWTYGHNKRNLKKAGYNTSIYIQE